MDFSTHIIVFLVSLVAGFTGAILGLGGGIILIPFLTLAIHLPIQEAIGVSIVSVIATSSGAAIAYVRDKITNIRIGMFLETATTLGAVTGAFIAGLLNAKMLYFIFSIFMFYSAFNMFKSRHSETSGDVKTHPMAVKLKLNGKYFDQLLNKTVSYQVAGVYPAYIVMYIAGILSGLLGIGGGAFKVLGMDMFMKLPIKVSTSTSNFMIGVTAAASAGVYFSRGDINPSAAGPVALGVLIGAHFGSIALHRISNKHLRVLFIPVLVIVAAQMIWKGWWS